MLRGFYTATAGMATEMSAIDLLTNNVSNSTTVGFKEDFASLLRQGANPLSYGDGGLVTGTGILSVNTTPNLSQGPLTQTNGQFDVALQGPGMFGLNSPAGPVYTRNGRFQVNALNQLVTESGNFVLDVNGHPIQLPDQQGQPVNIAKNGDVQVGNTKIATIGVFNAAGWKKAGNWLYAPTGPVTNLTTTPVQQGMLEASNVDLVSTMGTIMSVERSYEAANQLQKQEDTILQSSVNDIARMP